MSWRILYVDDDPDLREIAQMSLELDPELEVRCCGSGEEALGEIAAWRPDLLLLDVMMPEMDGPTTLGRVTQAGIAPDLVIVFITALAADRDTARLKALGAAGVITKPFDPMGLAEQVRAYLPAR